MSIPSFGQLVKSNLFLPALVFLSVNVWGSNVFYQVNSYKILVLGVGVALLAVLVDLFFPQKTEGKIPWKVLGLISLSILATFPGYFWHGRAYNYHFAYELSAFIILSVWVLYLYRGAQREEDLSPFFFVLGLTIFYVGIWALLERIGYHPLAWNVLPEPRVEATFGNSNYFAGFLIVLMPLLLVLAVPSAILRPGSVKKRIPLFSISHLYYLSVFCVAVLSLLLTQTRAAIAAGALGLMLVVILFAYFSPSDIWRKRFLILLWVCFGIGLLLIASLIAFGEQLTDSRFAALFTSEGWATRIVAWEAAIHSIIASPLVGFGLGSSYDLFYLFVNPDARLYSAEHGYNHAHSEILEYLQEAGGLGLLVFLFFWGFLVYRLLNALRSPSATPLAKKLIIGILGGFLGYHVHGLFDVAPRMMVMRLPLYTLLTMAFLVIFKFQAPPPEAAGKRAWSRRLSLFSPSFVLILAFCALYLPWVAGQFQYVKIKQERPSLLQGEKLEELVKKFPDVYALQDLTRFQLKYHRFDQLEETIKIIEQMMPCLRHVGHTKAMLAMLKKDYPKAIQLGLELQEKDVYFKPTIFLLIHLALETDNFELFWQQFQLWYRTLIYESDLAGGRKANQVIVKKTDMNDPLVIREENGSLVTVWDEKIIHEFFRISRSAQKDDQQKKLLFNYLVDLFPGHPYFQLHIKNEYTATERETIDKNVERYFAAQAKLMSQSEALDEKLFTRLSSTSPAERRSLLKKQAKEKARIVEPFKTEMEKMEDYLIAKADWKIFLKKRNLANSFIREFLNS
jgi:hypothetical protein